MHVLAAIGTRPEAIKMAPVIGELKRRDAEFRVSVCLTAQHRELLDQAVDLFGFTVDYDLDLMRPNQTLFDVTVGVLRGIGHTLEEAKPDVLLVHGDTTTSFAAALAAYYKKVPIGHVEAGLRTHDKFSPFPEEMNRKLCDGLCDYHYAPTESSRENLLREGIPRDHIVVTGNTVIDALLDVAQRPHTFEDPLLRTIGLERRLILVTAHRRESFGGPFGQMCAAIRCLAHDNPGVEILYPVHPNPNVRRTVEETLGNTDRVHLVEPLEYAPFVHLLKRAVFVLTDSGGLQEEAPALGKPVLVMREVTERPEAIEAGTAQLVGTTRDGIVAAAQRLLDDPDIHGRMANAVNPYGDGQARFRIADHLASLRALIGASH
ncbi:MAG: UDP-N-acetylglucosamine 2-epimerase (non-hydrolyzing) [Nitrospiraceae bacterium]|nr:UDP-N-acetylglucosamine 2-epimerase (non-hydrolyzing) [Nitrospiraceae bacterium]